MANDDDIPIILHPDPDPDPEPYPQPDPSGPVTSIPTGPDIVVLPPPVTAIPTGPDIVVQKPPIQGRRPGQHPPPQTGDTPPPYDGPIGTLENGVMPLQNPPQGPYRTDVFTPVEDPLPVIYGEVKRVGGQVWYDKVQADGSRIVLYAVCHGQINQLTNPTIEDQPLSAFNMTLTTNYNLYVGTSGQTADPFLTAAEASFSSGLPYVAYAVLKFPKPSATQPAPDVKRFLVDVQGMLVRDPRTDPTLVNRYYRDNPYLCIADFMSSPTRTAADGSKYTYGAGHSVDASHDWSGTITTSANAADVLMADGTSKRFTIGWIVNEKKNWREHVNDMRAHCQGLFPQWNAGLWQYPIDITQAASGIVLTDVGASANIVAASPLAVKPSSQCYTDVWAKFIDPASSYKDNQTHWPDPGVGTGALDPVSPPSPYRFGAIPYDQATRLCRYLQRRSAKDQSATLYLLQDSGVQLLPGMRVAVTSSQLGWSSQDVIIASLRSSRDPRWAWEAAVELYDATIYDDTQASTTPASPPVSPSPYDKNQDVTFIINNVGSDIEWYFSAPQVRTAPTYGSGQWSATNTSSFIAAKVNDLDLVTNAIVFNAGAGTLILDAGSAIAFREVYIVASSGTINFQSHTLEYSDNASSWTSITKRYDGSRAGGPNEQLIQWDSVGAHRYWRISTAAGSETWTEVQFYTWAGPSPFIANYNIYDLSAGYARLSATIGGGTTFTSASPLLLSDIEYVLGNYRGTNFIIKAVTSAGVETLGVSASYLILSTGSTALFVTAGDTQTIKNKTLDDTNSITVKDNAFTVEGHTDTTKKVLFDVETNIPTATTKTQKLPNATKIAAQDIDNAFSADQTITGLVKPSLGVQERSRSTPLGESIGFTPTRSAAGGQTWTAGTTSSCKYTLVGKYMILSISVTGSTISGATGRLDVTIPGGFSVAGAQGGSCSFSDNGTAGTGYWQATNGAATKISFYKDYNSGTNWAASTTNTSVDVVAVIELA